jgi:hypothetical protein
MVSIMKPLKLLKTLMKPADFLVLLLSIILVLAGTLLTRDGAVPALVRIEWDGKTLIYPLEEARTIPLDNHLGYNLLVISGTGEVSITDADCPDKLCVGMGPISQNGQYLACLPHRLFITITGKEEDTVDSALW